MKNAAYTKEYHKYRQQQEKVYCAENLCDEESTALSAHLSAVKRCFRVETAGYLLHASECELTDETKSVVYTWRNINDDGEFYKIIEHSDGNQYLIFRIDLYGYSVLNLSTLQDFHYIPSGSFPEGETFIWTDVFYNRKNNMLAVSGCYWACPYEIMLLDFSRPMTEPEELISVQKCLAHSAASYDDIDFAAWRGTDLILHAFNTEDSHMETIVLSEDTYNLKL